MARKYTRVEFTFDECEVYPDKYIKELVDDLRSQDMADLIAACGNAEDAIRMSVAFSEIVYFYLDDTGKCISVLGLGAHDDATLGRQIWSVSTNEVEQGYIKSLIIKEAKKVVGAWAHKYGLLQNLVNKDNSKSIEYMSRILGAVFLPEHINTNGHIWKPFYIIGKGGY